MKRPSRRPAWAQPAKYKPSKREQGTFHTRQVGDPPPPPLIEVTRQALAEAMAWANPLTEPAGIQKRNLNRSWDTRRNA